jgi:hypothetical protein
VYTVFMRHQRDNNSSRLSITHSSQGLPLWRDSHPDAAVLELLAKTGTQLVLNHGTTPFGYVDALLVE